MGGRGSFDTKTMSIPVENRKYQTLDVIDGIKIIEDFESGNGKTPVMSNTANTTYALWSESAGRIKHIFYYKDHILHYQNMCIEKNIPLITYDTLLFLQKTEL